MKPRWINWLLIASIVLAVSSVLVTYLGYKKRRESERWVTHTHEAIETAYSMLSNVMDAESSQRSFLLTSDTTYLSPYRASFHLTENLADKLRALAADNADQTALVNTKIIPASRYKIREWSETIDILHDQGTEAAVSFLKDQNGNAVLDTLWASTKQFIAREENWLTERKAMVASDDRLNNLIRNTSFIIVAFASLLALITIRRQQSENGVLVEGLKNLNLDLEQRIIERTADLKTKNDYAENLNRTLKLQHKRVEQSLQEVKDLYDNAPCGYHSIDKKGIIVRMNKTELNWLGYSENEVIGKMHISRIVDPSFINGRDENIKLLIENGHLNNIEFDMIRKDGSKLSVLMNSSAVFDSKGDFIRNRSTVFDISQRKQLEEKLLTAHDHLMLVNEEKNRFIGITSHDLKNPLNGIAGLIQLLKNHTTLSPDQRQYVGFIDDSIGKMKNLINKLLDLNRIEQGGNIVKKEKFDLQAFLETIVKSYDETAIKKSIQLQIENPVGPIQIETDPTLLEQAIDNFVSNAIKFSSSNKKVWIRTARLSNNLMIEIEDQGPGIKPEEIPRLFGTFQRLSAQPTAGEESTGLGLSIAKGLIKSLGGEVKVESEVGKGSKFMFIIKV